MADFRKENEESAKSSVKMRLVLEAIYKDAKLEVEEKEVDEKVKELANAYGRKEDELKANEELMKNIKNSIETEKAVNYLVENAKIAKKAGEKKTEKTTKTAKASKTEKKDKSEKEDKKEEKTTKTEKKTTEKKSSK